MNKIKIVLLIVLIMFVSGCKIRSNVSVSLDGVVTEKVTITELKNGNNLSQKEYSNYIDMELKNYKTLINYGKYKYKKINDKNNFGIEFTKKYDSICSYFQDTLFNQYIYKHISCSEDQVFIFVANDTPFLDRKNKDDFSNPLDLDDVQLKISLPVKATSNNADEIKENTYIWKFDDNSSGKNIELKINKNDLKQTNVNYLDSKKKNEILNKVIIIAVTISIFVIIITIVLTLYKKYKENKIEY